MEAMFPTRRENCQRQNIYMGQNITSMYSITPGLGARGPSMPTLMRVKDAQKHSSHEWFVRGLYQAMDAHINSRVLPPTLLMRVGNARFVSRVCPRRIGN